MLQSKWLGVFLVLFAWGSSAEASIPGDTCEPDACYEEVECGAEGAHNCWEIETSVGQNAQICTASGCVAGRIQRGRELCVPTPDLAGASTHVTYEIDAANLKKPLPKVPFNITVPGVSDLITVSSVGANGVQLKVLANDRFALPFPPIPLANPAWVCFRADQKNGTSFTRVFPDQFGDPLVKVGNLTELCVAGSFDGSVPSGGLAFACFAASQVKPRVNGPLVYVSDPIRQWQFDVHPDYQGFCSNATIVP